MGTLTINGKKDQKLSFPTPESLTYGGITALEASLDSDLPVFQFLSKESTGKAKVLEPTRSHSGRADNRQSIQQRQ